MYFGPKAVAMTVSLGGSVGETAKRTVPL